jgi:hypothetical protein
MGHLSKIAVRHFMLSDNFFQLVESVLTETLSHNNVALYAGPPREDITEHYRQMTKWSDFRILIPTLFNFFHGIELILKAANYKITPPLGQPNHKLTQLFAKFKSNYPTSTELIRIFEKYIFPSAIDCKILNSFYASNKMEDSGQFYEVFKYPYSKNFQFDFDYSELRNLESDGTDFFMQIIKDIQIIRIESDQL